MPMFHLSANRSETLFRWGLRRLSRCLRANGRSLWHTAFGRKTENLVLRHAFGQNEGIVVDTHVIRLSQRLKLTKNRDAEKIERNLMKIVPQRDWTLWSHWLIWHGRRRCFARKPDCANCGVFALCPSGRIFLRPGH